MPPVVNVDAIPESVYTQDRNAATRGLWLGLLIGPIIYASYFVAGYLLAEATCLHNLFSIGTTRLVPVIAGLTVIAGLATLYFTWLSQRRWQQYHGREDALGGALAFMAFGGIFLNGLFTLLIAMTGVAAFFVDTCQWI